MIQSRKSAGAPTLMSPLGVIVAIVLVDLLGFTIVMPLLGPFAKEFALPGWQVGLLFSAYPMCQLVAGPILGRMSDRYGRRPILIASQFGTAVSFLMLGLANDFPTMFLARMLDGASGGNILVAQAYVADVTSRENRARGLGLIGMAFGIGFVLGPLLGGLLLMAPLPLWWRIRLPFLVAAGFSVLALLLVVEYLPESLPSREELLVPSRVLSWHGLLETVKHPAIGRLVGVGFLVTLAFASLEGTYSLYLRERMGWDARGAAFAFVFLGLVSAVVQGGLIRRLVPQYGESRLIVIGIATTALGMALLARASGVFLLLLATLLVALGQGLVSPTISGLLSRVTPPNEQGSIFGTLSSSQTLARMISYSASNILFARVAISAPYWQAFGIDLLALALAVLTIRRLERPALEAVVAETAARGG